MPASKTAAADCQNLKNRMDLPADAEPALPQEARNASHCEPEASVRAVSRTDSSHKAWIACSFSEWSSSSSNHRYTSASVADENRPDENRTSTFFMLSSF